MQMKSHGILTLLFLLLILNASTHDRETQFI